mgnify:FL=1
MSYVQSLFHVVLNTKHQEMSINPDESGRLFAYMIGVLIKNDCIVLAINGIPNHIHILLSLSSSKALSDVIRDLKRASSHWMKESGRYPIFKGWSKEFASFSLSYTHKDAVASYIQNQQEHHKELNFESEYQNLILKNWLVFYKIPED